MPDTGGKVASLRIQSNHPATYLILCYRDASTL
jgi:hypothetical protein